MLHEIGRELGQSMWLSTQTAGQSLRAVAMYLTYFPMGKQMNFAVNYKNKPQDYQSRNMTHRMELGKGKTESIIIENKGSGTIYARIIRKGIPVESDLPAAMNNMTMKVSYTSLDGKKLNPESIDQGTVFYADVTVSHPGNFNAYRSMALTQIFPSGWEIMSDRFAFDDYTARNFTYQDIRDDRVITYFDLPKGGTMAFRVRLSASFAGTFYMPAVYCEAMYDNRINASVQGKWVKVADPNDKVTSDARAAE
jgi:alpha-2-macroglobulin